MRPLRMMRRTDIDGNDEPGAQLCSIRCQALGTICAPLENVTHEVMFNAGRRYVGQNLSPIKGVI